MSYNSNRLLPKGVLVYGILELLNVNIEPQKILNFQYKYDIFGYIFKPYTFDLI